MLKEDTHTRSKQEDVCEVGGGSDVQLQSKSFIYLFIYSTSLDLDFKEITSVLRRKNDEQDRSSI